MAQGSSQPPHRVTILAAENSNPFELACACEVFGASRTADLGFEIYDTTVASATRTVRMRDGIFSLAGTSGLEALEDADTIVVPNRPDVGAPTHPRVVRAIRAAHQRGARLVGLCTGAFTLAEAGILHGRSATVHWQLLDEFVARYPDVDVKADVLYVDEGDVLTSAGGAAALDLALHIVRSDHGASIANSVSRRLVFSGFRHGGQQQFVDRPLPATDDLTLGPVLDWARNRLNVTLTVSAIAERARVSPATLFRRFRSELGLTPLEWLSRERVDLAKQLLEQPGLSIYAVAARCGLGSSANLRLVFKRATGVSPSVYRQHFAR